MPDSASRSRPAPRGGSGARSCCGLFVMEAAVLFSFGGERGLELLPRSARMAARPEQLRRRVRKQVRGELVAVEPGGGDGGLQRRPPPLVAQERCDLSMGGIYGVTVVIIDPAEIGKCPQCRWIVAD